jgi:hypothetical protein
VRLRLIDAETGATATREDAHAREMEYGRRQQQVQFDRQQIDLLAQQAEGLDAEARDLEARREPARQASESQRQNVVRAREALDAAAARVTDCNAEYTSTLSAVHAVEQESDATRAAVLSAVTTLAALSQARDNAAAARDRVAADRERLSIESGDLVPSPSAPAWRNSRRRRRLSVRARRSSRLRARAWTPKRCWRNTAPRANRCIWRSALGSASSRRSRARLGSLEELEASRATYGDAARFCRQTGLARAPARRRRGSSDRRALIRARGGRVAGGHAPARGRRSRRERHRSDGARGA